MFQNFLFAFLFIFKIELVSSQCLISLKPGYCAFCSALYYDYLFSQKLKMGYNENFEFLASSCLPKQNSTILTRKILVLNRECPDCIISDFEEVYYDFVMALQTENLILVNSTLSQLEINLQDGEHFILPKSLISSGIELFRNSLIDIIIQPFRNSNFSNVVKINLKTDEFYFFISKTFIVHDILFDGGDIIAQSQNDTNACYNQNSPCCSHSDYSQNYINDIDTICALKSRSLLNFDKKYGLFNVEFQAESNINPNLTLINCKFENFFVLHGEKGFSSLITLAPYSGNILLKNFTLNHSYFENGIVFYNSEGFDPLSSLLASFVTDDLSLLENVKKFLNESVQISNGNFINYNPYENYGFTSALFKFQSWKGFINIEYSLFSDIRCANYLIFLENYHGVFSSLKIFGVLLTDHWNTSFVHLINVEKFSIMNCSAMNFHNLINDFLFFSSIKYLFFEGFYSQNMQTLASLNSISWPFFINVLDSDFLIQNFHIKNNSFSSIISFTGYNSLTIRNSSFSMIYYTQKGIISFSQGQTIVISTSFFQNVKGFYPFFNIWASISLRISDVFLTNIFSTTIFYLDDVERNDNNGLIVTNSFLNYIWQSGETCHFKNTSSSLIKGNIISSAVYISSSSGNDYFILDSTTIIENNSSASFFIKIVGYGNLTNLVIIDNFFMNIDKYQFLIEFVNYNFYMTDCYIENNGVLSRKSYYLDTSLNDVIVVWLVQYTYFARLNLIATSKVELGSGFFMGNPHGGFFEMYDSQMIIASFNTNFTYKGIILDHITGGIIKNCSFYNILCNTRNYMNSQGGILFTAATSYHYVFNNIAIEFIDCKFINCSCDRGGSLTLLSMTYIKLIGCIFKNTTANLIGGHFLIAGSQTLLIENTTFDKSQGNYGAGFYIYYSKQVIIRNGSLSNAFSKTDAMIFVRSVVNLTMTNYFVFNSSCGFSGGFLYARDANLSILNLLTNLTSTNLFGGSIASFGQGSLILMNCSFNNSMASIGGAVYVEIESSFECINCLFTNVISSFNGGAIFIKAVGFNLLNAVSMQNINCLKGYGVISIEVISETSIINWENITCSNSSAYKGSFLYYNSASQLKINNAKLINNKQINIILQNSFDVKISIANTSILYSSSANIIFYINGVTLEANSLFLFHNDVTSSSLDSALFQFIKANGNLTNIHMMNNSGEWAFYLDKGNFKISNSFLTNNQTHRNLAVLSSVNSFIGISNFTVENLRSWREKMFDMQLGTIIINQIFFDNNIGVALNFINTNLSLTNSKFNFNYPISVNIPCDINAINQNPSNIYEIFIVNCSFSINQAFSMKIDGFFVQTILSSTFLSEISSVSTKFTKTKAISIINPLIIFISNTSFENYSNNAMEFIFDQINSQFLPKILIEKSQFIKCKAILGGALFFNGTFQVIIIDSIFLQNYAYIENLNSTKEGYGGAVLFTPIQSESNRSQLTFNNCQFINNWAQYIAATVFSLIEIQNIFSNYFQNNSDGCNFTQKMFSFPVSLSFINDFHKEINPNKISIKSGSLFSLKFQIHDFLNQRINIDNSTLLTLKPMNGQLVILNSLKISKMGIVNFADLIIKTIPNSSFSLTVEGSFLGVTAQFQKEQLKLTLNFYSQSCDIGEIMKIDRTCYRCDVGTYSLIDPMAIDINRQKCYSCPENGYCPGGYQINPLPGYYRMYNHSESLVACQNLEACLGMPIIIIFSFF